MCFRRQQIKASVFPFLALLCLGIGVTAHHILGQDTAFSFCQDRTFISSKSEPAGVVTLLQKDISFPDALLVVVTSQVKGDFRLSASSLLRLHQNGTSKWLTGKQGLNNFVYSVNSFQYISGLHQHDSSILIADSKLKCFRTLKIASNEVNEYSGTCLPSGFEQTELPIRDGPLFHATYREPKMITKSPLSLNKILVSDRNTVREIDLISGSVVTRYTRQVPYSSPFTVNNIIWQGSYYIVSSNEGIHKFSKDWVFLEHIVHKHVNGGVTKPDEAVGKYFYMMKLTDDIIILKYKTVPKNLTVDGLTDIRRHVALFSVEDESSINNLDANHSGFGESNSLTPPWRDVGYTTDHKLYFLGESRTSGLCDAVYVRTVADYCLHENYRYKIGSQLINQTYTVECEVDHMTLDVDWVQRPHGQPGPNITAQTPSISYPSVIDDLVANTTTINNKTKTTSSMVGKQLSSSDTVMSTTITPDRILVRNNTAADDVSSLDDTHHDRKKTIIQISITCSVLVTVICCLILAHRFNTGRFLWQWQRCHEEDEAIENPNANRALPLTPHQPGLSEDADPEYSTVSDPVPDNTRDSNGESSTDAGELPEENTPYTVYDVPVEHDEHFEYVLDAEHVE